MTITELVQAVGPEHIELQNLQENYTEAKMKKGVGQITFNTAPGKVVDLMLENESTFVGIAAAACHAQGGRQAGAAEPRGGAG